MIGSSFGFSQNQHQLFTVFIILFNVQLFDKQSRSLERGLEDELPLMLDIVSQEFFLLGTQPFLQIMGSGPKNKLRSGTYARTMIFHWGI